jgi:Lon protease-like protein
LFPLQVVLFPGMVLPLHIFEERYKRMIADCLAGEPRFGVALISKGREVGAPAEVHDVGAIARIIRVGRYEDGRMDLITVGLQRFRVLGINDELPYLRADVEIIDDGPEREPEALESKARAVCGLLRQYKELLGVDGEEAPWAPEDAQALSYLGGGLDLPLREKQLMLQSLSTSDRLAQLARALEREIQLYKVLGPTRPAHNRHGPSLD